MWTSKSLFPDLLFGLLVAACAFWAIVRMYDYFFRFWTRARSNRPFVNSLLGRTELRLHVPPNIAQATRGRGFRIQLGVLGRELNNLVDTTTESATLTELHPSTATPSMTEEETNAMPIQKYNVNSQANASSSATEASSSRASGEDRADVYFNEEAEDALICYICSERIFNAHLVHRLPCSHQFHLNCIKQWFKKHSTCPECTARM
ncbi:hypothetical protein M9H77_15835 [Catharanthus roseus]|uniref:Uncharacterized protein n=1 Tax=Catharanthus roseus TaxID=4058 RepID=A0ACC0AY83_CATRO|nr:hypothetical protein M9H77_15835 [Catharanthus roseus]